MSLIFYCIYCDKELNEFGGILLSPPDECGKPDKYHICASCYEERFKELKAKVICRLIDSGIISMIRGRKLLSLKYMEEMREIYNGYVREQQLKAEEG